jgi:hypothetical protein
VAWIASSLQRKIALRFCRELLAMTATAGLMSLVIENRQFMIARLGSLSSRL